MGISLVAREALPKASHFISCKLLVKNISLFNVDCSRYAPSRSYIHFGRHTWHYVGFATIIILKIGNKSYTQFCYSAEKQPHPCVKEHFSKMSLPKIMHRTYDICKFVCQYFFISILM